MSSSFSAVATFSSVTTAAGRIHHHASDQLRNRRFVALVNNNNNSNSRRSEVLLAPRADASSSYGSGEYGTVPRHNVAIGGHNPTGGDASMDEARVVDPYGLVGGKGKQNGGGGGERRRGRGFSLCLFAKRKKEPKKKPARPTKNKKSLIFYSYSHLSVAGDAVQCNSNLWSAFVFMYIYAIRTNLQDEEKDPRA